MIPASYRPHYPIQKCRRPRYRKSSGPVEVLVCLGAVAVFGAVAYAMGVWR